MARSIVMRIWCATLFIPFTHASIHFAQVAPFGSAYPFQQTSPSSPQFVSQATSLLRLFGLNSGNGASVPNPMVQFSLQGVPFNNAGFQNAPGFPGQGQSPWNIQPQQPWSGFEFQPIASTAQIGQPQFGPWIDQMNGVQPQMAISPDMEKMQMFMGQRQGQIPMQSMITAEMFAPQFPQSPDQFGPGMMMPQIQQQGLIMPQAAIPQMPMPMPQQPQQQLVPVPDQFGPRELLQSNLLMQQVPIPTQQMVSEARPLDLAKTIYGHSPFHYGVNYISPFYSSQALYHGPFGRPMQAPISVPQAPMFGPPRPPDQLGRGFVRPCAAHPLANIMRAAGKPIAHDCPEVDVDKKNDK